MMEGGSASRPWAKLWTDALDSRKLAKVGRSAELTFFHLILVAAERGGSGLIDMDLPDLAWRLRRDERPLADELQALVEHGLVVPEGPFWRIVSWGPRQAATTSTDRMREHRARKRAEAQAGDSRSDGAAVTGDSVSRATGDRSEQSRAGQSRAGQRIPPARTDAELLPFFDAWCRGVGRDMTWDTSAWDPTERIRATGASVAEIELAARCYDRKLSPGLPRSLARFAMKAQQWLAESRAPDVSQSDRTRRSVDAVTRVVSRMEETAR